MNSDCIFIGQFGLSCCKHLLTANYMPELAEAKIRYGLSCQVTPSCGEDKHNFVVVKM